MTPVKSPQEIARAVSALMEDLQGYLDVEGAKLSQNLRTGKKPPTQDEMWTYNLLAELYGPMIKWKFDVERLALEKDNERV